MDVRLPNGTIITNVPEGTTKAELDAKLSVNAQSLPQNAEDLRSGQVESLLNPAANERNIPAVLAQSLGKGFSNVGDFLIGAPKNLAKIGGYTVGKLAGKDVEYPRYETPVTNQLVKHGIFTPQNEPNTPILKVADFATQAAAPGIFTKANSIPSFLAKQAENVGRNNIRNSQIFWNYKSIGRTINCIWCYGCTWWYIFYAKYTFYRS